MNKYAYAAEDALIGPDRSSSRRGPGRYYTIQRGDSLWRVAAAELVSQRVSLNPTGREIQDYMTLVRLANPVYQDQERKLRPAFFPRWSCYGFRSRRRRPGERGCYGLLFLPLHPKLRVERRRRRKRWK